MTNSTPKDQLAEIASLRNFPFIVLMGSAMLLMLLVVFGIDTNKNPEYPLLVSVFWAFVAVFVGWKDLEKPNNIWDWIWTSFVQCILIVANTLAIWLAVSGAGEGIQRVMRGN